MLQKSNAQKIIRGIFPKLKVVSIREFKKGMMNRTYDVKLSNKENVVLRVYPRESWKAVKEKYLYELVAKKVKVPVPHVYRIDTSKKTIPFAYSVLSKLKGRELGKIYLKTKNKKLIRDAATYLAKMHSIKFNSFGWIIGKEIKPRFSTWKGYFDYGLKHKLDKIKKITKVPKQIIKETKKYVEEHQELLDIKSKPCLIHKDYHFSHIIADEKKINGIIDFEWAISGHNELDLIKSEWWMFEKLPEIRPIFHKAYKQAGGVISSKFEKRKKLYELKILIGMISLSYKRKSRHWFNYNIKEAKKILNT
ncbi:aminoglycoside phosphotransferase family protein [Candidatus Woesearchaeota archaeon]|nr:aminoglycoside phosphotransferase family protein [Candidatus Woesearchaeota archaeon]